VTSLRVRLLGEPLVEGREEKELGSRKARTLLKVLALAHGAPVPVDHLVDVLWPGPLPARPADEVAVLVSRLRAALGAERLVRRDAGYALAADWIDVDEVVGRADAAAARLADRDPAAARAEAEAGLALVRAEPAAGEDGPWVTAARRELAGVVASLRATAVAAAAEAGDHRAAQRHAEAALAVDPYDEVALRALLRAHIALGRPAAALAAYAEARGRLAEDLGVPPSAATEALHDAIVLEAEGGAGPVAGRAGPAPAGRAAPTERSAPPPVLPDPSAVRARVARLGPDAEATVLAGAVLGGELDVELLAALVGVSPAEVVAHLDLAAAQHLLAEDGGATRFADEGERQALAGAVSSTRARWLHANAVRVLGTRPRRDPLVLAGHARQAGDAPTAAAALADAAAGAASDRDLARAEALLDDAVALDATAAVHLARARVRLARGGLAAAQHDVARALELGGGTEAFEVAGWVAYYRRDEAAARRYAEEGAARATDPAVRAGCLALAGRSRHSAGALPAAADDLEAAAGGPPPVRATGQVWLGALRVHQGRLAEAEDLAARGLVDPHAVTHPFAPLHARFALVLAQGLRGRLAEAFAAVDAMAADVEALGERARRFLPVAANCRGWMLRAIGRTAEADEANQAAVELAAAVGFAEPANHARLDLVDGRLRAGDLHGAQAGLDEVAATIVEPGTMLWHQRQRLAWLRGRVDLRRGDPTGAAEAAAWLVADAAERGAGRYEVLGRVLGLAADALEDGRSPDPDAVRPLLARLDEVAVPDGWLLTAELAAASGAAQWWAEARQRVEVLAARAGAVPGGDPAATAAALDAALSRVRTG